MACLLGAAATSLYAQTAPKPKLTVVILLEQERYNDFIACSANFRENGLKKLIDDGTFFTEECPARAAFQVAKLPKDALVEIEAIAYAE